MKQPLQSSTEPFQLSVASAHPQAYLQKLGDKLMTPLCMSKPKTQGVGNHLLLSSDHRAHYCGSLICHWTHTLHCRSFGNLQQCVEQRMHRLNPQAERLVKNEVHGTSSRRSDSRFLEPVSPQALVSHCRITHCDHRQISSTV